MMIRLWALAAVALLLASPGWARDLNIKGDKICLHADEEPLQNILREISLQGIRIHIDPLVNPIVSADFDSRDLGDAIAALVAPNDHVLVWEEVPGASISFRLSEIQVFRPGQKERIQELRRRSFALGKDPRSGALFVKDELLVKVETRRDLEIILRAIGGWITDENAALGIYQISLPRDSDVLAIISWIDSLPGAVRAEPDYAYRASPLYPEDLPVADGARAATSHTYGKVSVAVLDSGMIQGAGLEGFVIASYDAVSPGQPMSDRIGHGTQMGLIAAGLVRPIGAKADDGGQVPLVAIRAMDDNGFTTDFTIMKSVEYAMESGARVLNISWGSETKSDFLESILVRAADRGMVVVASAGNEPTGRPVYPAAYPSVIGVGAVYPDGKTWEKSNFGGSVDLYAPGFANVPVGYHGDPGMYGGTSISAAFTSNRIAEYLSRYPESSFEEVEDAVNDTMPR